MSLLLCHNNVTPAAARVGCGFSASDFEIIGVVTATSAAAGASESSQSCSGRGLRSLGLSSVLEIVSRPAGASVEARTRVRGGVRLAAAAALAGSGPPGTNVRVTSLFEAWPVRRAAMLGQSAREFKTAAAALARMAVAHPRVALRLVDEDTAGGARVLDTGGSGAPADALAHIYGLPFVESLLPVELAARGVVVRGAVSRCRRPARDAQLVYVNGAPLAHAPRLVAAAAAATDACMAAAAEATGSSSALPGHAAFVLNVACAARVLDLDAATMRFATEALDPDTAVAVVRAAITAGLGAAVAAPQRGGGDEESLSLRAPPPSPARARGPAAASAAAAPTAPSIQADEEAATRMRRLRRMRQPAVRGDARFSMSGDRSRDVFARGVPPATASAAAGPACDDRGAGATWDACRDWCDSVLPVARGAPIPSRALSDTATLSRTELSASDIIACEVRSGVVAPPNNPQSNACVGDRAAGLEVHPGAVSRGHPCRAGPARGGRAHQTRGAGCKAAAAAA